MTHNYITYLLLLLLFCFANSKAQNSVDTKLNSQFWGEQGYFSKFSPSDEILSKRSESSKVFKPDAYNNFTVFIGDWHYKVADGSFQEINFTPEVASDTNYFLQNVSNRFQTYFGYLHNQGVKIAYEGNTVSFNNIAGIDVSGIHYQPDTVKPNALSNGVVYPNIFPSISNSYYLEANILSHQTVIHSADLFKNKSGLALFNEIVQIPTHAKLIDENGNTILNNTYTDQSIFVSNGDSVIMSIIQARIWDARFIGNPLDDEAKIKYDYLIKLRTKVSYINDTSIILSTEVPLSWINTPGRVFPLTLDPTVIIGRGIHTSAYQYPFKTDVNKRTTRYLLQSNILNVSGYINSISYLLTSNNDLPTDSLQIKMEHTTTTEITSPIFGPIPMTMVYENLSDNTFTTGASSSGAWRSIALTTPFLYDGTSNLYIENRFYNTSFGSGGTFKSGTLRYNCAVRGSCNCTDYYVLARGLGGNGNYGNQIPYIQLTIGDSLPTLVTCTNSVVDVFSKKNKTSTVKLGNNILVSGERGSVEWKFTAQRSISPAVMGLYLDSTLLERRIVNALLGDTIVFTPPIASINVEGADSGMLHDISLRYVDGSSNLSDLNSLSAALCITKNRVYSKKITINALTTFRRDVGDTLALIINKNLQEPVKVYVFNTTTLDSTLINASLQFDSATYNNELGTCRMKWIVPSSYREGAYGIKVRGTLSDSVFALGAYFIIGSCMNDAITTSVEGAMATEFLCFNSLIDSMMPVSTILNSKIKQNEAAVLTFNAAYFLKPLARSNLPSDSFPVPFINMQGTSYREAKALMYLIYDNFDPGFPRNNFFFRYNDSVTRGLALRIIMESFNVMPPENPRRIFTDVSAKHIYSRWIQYAAAIGIVDTASRNFLPDNAITYIDYYKMLFRVMTNYKVSKYIPYPDPQRSDYYTPSNLTPKTLPYGIGKNNGFFTAGGDMPFSFSGNGLSLEFGFFYSSAVSDLPNEFYRELSDTLGHNFQPLGIGWTHAQNFRVFISKGYSPSDTRYCFIYPDNSVHVYDRNTASFDTRSVYDSVAFSGSNIILRTTGLISYTFSNLSSDDYYFLTKIEDRDNNSLSFSYINIGTGKYLQYITDDRSPGATRKIDIQYSTDNPGKINMVKEQGFGSSTRSVSFIYNGDKLALYKDLKGRNYTMTYETQGNQWPYLFTNISYPKGNGQTISYRNSKVFKITQGTNTVTYTFQPRYAQNIDNDYIRYTVTNSTGLSNTSRYDKSNRLQSSNSPTQNLTVSSYAPDLINYMLPEVVQINGITYTTRYNTKGKVLNTKKESGSILHESSYTYTSFNDVRNITDSRGYTTTLNYTGSRLTGIDLPGAYGEFRIERNIYGNITLVTSPATPDIPAGVYTRITYDVSGRIITSSNPLGSDSATYDDVDNLINSYDANRKYSSLSYFDDDQIQFFTETEGTRTELIYNENGVLESIITPKGATSFGYSFEEENLENTAFGNAGVQINYNSIGLPSNVIKNGQNYPITYDPATLLLTSSMNNIYTYTTDGRFNVRSIQNIDYNITLNYSYDAFNRITRVECIQPGRTSVVSYQYETNSNFITNINYGSSGKYVSYTYDALGKIYEVRNQSTTGTTPLAAYTYYIDGRLHKVDYFNGTKTTYTYDRAARLTGIYNTLPNGRTICSNRFDLDEAGYHEKEYFAVPGSDAANPLLTYESKTYGNSPYNRTESMTRNGIVNTIQYDENGNMIRLGALSFEWDAKDMLKTLLKDGAVEASYKYDGTGARRYKELSNNPNISRIYYMLDLGGMVLNDHIRLRSGAETDIFYYYGPEGLICREFGSSTEFYHFDARGSTLATTNQYAMITHGFMYDHEGKVLNRYLQAYDSIYPFTYTFVAQHGVQEDEQELYYMQARYMYQPIGKFISEDPIWATNLYTYAGNDPVNNIDPTGNEIVDLSYENKFKTILFKAISFIAPGTDLADAFISYNIGKQYHKLGDLMTSYGNFSEATQYYDLAIKEYDKGIKSATSELMFLPLTLIGARGGVGKSFKLVYSPLNITPPIVKEYALGLLKVDKKDLTKLIGKNGEFYKLIGVGLDMNSKIGRFAKDFYYLYATLDLGVKLEIFDIPQW